MRIVDLIDAVGSEGRAVLVLVAESKGSAPRDAGAAMVVTNSAAIGTIGGGTVEHRAVAQARAMLAEADTHALTNPLPSGGRGDEAAGLVRDFPLGPDLDQCCGGHMRLAFATFGAGDLEMLHAAQGEFALWRGGPVFVESIRPRQVLVYGGGHVGTALVRALAPLPLAVRWVGVRLDALPADVPTGVQTVITPLPETEALAAATDALHVVLTYSHALDMEIVTAVMERGEFGYLGVIGSATKRALFLRRLRERGIAECQLARLVCPIGVPGLRDKRPEVIAASVAIQLLQIALGAVEKSRETT